MRRMIAALQVSVDGSIEGPNGELDWAMAEDEETWTDIFDALTHVDTFILGRGMYPAYEEYWLAVLANPAGILPFSGRIASKNEVTYARLADQTPQIVVPTTLNKVAWKTTRIVRDVEDLRRLKQQPGKDMHVVGGATLVSSLMNLGLIDELGLMVNPLVRAAERRCSRT
jgi:dihydrofolate reductase